MAFWISLRHLGQHPPLKRKVARGLWRAMRQGVTTRQASACLTLRQAAVHDLHA